MKEWVFTKPISLLVVKRNGRHFAVETPKGWVEKEENVLVTRSVKNVLDLKTLRKDIKTGKYQEVAHAPICDQLWAAIAHKIGFLKIIEKEEDDET
tara:strand:+ start:66374 stop:66661 length:288 start_codon:yes stop_codon:yes gene_type:complete